jgi:DNA-binding CsgD family transcriptional regulator
VSLVIDPRADHIERAAQMQTTNTVEAAPEPPNEPANIYWALRTYIRSLADADTPEAVFVALSAFGAHFRMPHMQIAESLTGDTTAQVRPVYVSPDVPRAALDALRSHPLYEWARDARTPVFLSDADEVLALRGLRRAPELAAFEAFMATLEVAPGHLRHYGFFGEGGLANGLSRSLLHVAVLRAHERLLVSSAPAIAAPAAAVRGVPTPREREVLDLAMAGVADAEIGRTLGMATRTVRFHLQNLARKFHLSSRRELIALAAQGLGVDRK